MMELPRRYSTPSEGGRFEPPLSSGGADRSGLASCCGPLPSFALVGRLSNWDLNPYEVWPGACTIHPNQDAPSLHFVLGTLGIYVAARMPL
jgi:hypothetical protein